jgi:hypothetical protein
MNNAEEGFVVPFAPGPLDMFRRRPATLFINKLQSTRPIKNKLTCKSQIFVVHPLKESVKITVQK